MNHINQLKIAISGASGLVGSALRLFFESAGHQVTALVRQSPKAENSIYWQPGKGKIEGEKLEGMDVLIHLSGENIAQGRWHQDKKQRILDSRVQSTQLLAKTLLQLHNPPAIFISASATGFYGHAGSRPLTESSPPGQDFLANVCQQWEAASQPVLEKGIRLVNPRIGMVLSAKGGALGKMRLPFSLGLGGRLGHGQQYMNWIALDDLTRVLYFCMLTPELSGPVNCVAPQSLPNAEFTRALGQALHRPTPFPVPPFALKLLFGEMAEALLLSSANVQPQKLLEAGYEFNYPDLTRALKELLT